MKITNKPTEAIIIKAFTTSEWDDVSFAFFRIPKPALEVIKQRKRAVEQLKHDRSFYNISFWDAPDDWFLLDDMSDLGSEKDLQQFQDNGWSFVEFFDEELVAFQHPEQTIDSQQMCVTPGSFYFKAYGKHSNEEFYTESVDFDDLLK